MKRKKAEPEELLAAIADAVDDGFCRLLPSLLAFPDSAIATWCASRPGGTSRPDPRAPRTRRPGLPGLDQRGLASAALFTHLLTFDEPDPAAVGIARHRAVVAVTQAFPVSLLRSVDVHAGGAALTMADAVAVVLDRAIGVDHGRAVLTV